MASEGLRVSLTLVDLMNLNLVHRRLERIATSGEFVTPEEIEGLVSIMDGVFGVDGTQMRTMINNLRRAQHGG